ncbi:hypothetical protein [Phenylobacterium sp.]|jgi:hypothetical protein|uniref:hypothetical protein n=1 Tax=Phenylobacterium sp. TaxID=1871053 RepID=UPI002E30C6BA|nr:hypothetical protein [Phenylobacterium sp.]HEX2560558.1 hypothetical protein [Phenylobacterium sp.]
MNTDAVTQAVNFAILVAHRLGEPRVLELSHPQYRQLRRAADPADWSLRSTYRGLRVVETDEPDGRVLVWDRMRETEMVQRIDWPAGRG